MFVDRVDAGRQLAERLRHLTPERTVVLGLPRGGVPVAAEVAAALGAPLDVIVVRKVGVPFQPELAMGAIAEGDVRVVDDDIVRRAHVAEPEFADREREQHRALDARIARFRGGRAPVDLTGSTAVVVDDGVATGSTARAACRAARQRRAARVVLAVPVAPQGWERQLGDAADEYVSVLTPAHLNAVGEWYADFGPTSDEEVVEILRRAHREPPACRPIGEPPVGSWEVVVETGTARLPGRLTVPRRSCGIVIFAHGSGSSRWSPRNRYVASVLHDRGIGTLLFDLLEPAEERIRANVFDIDTLAGRLIGATIWLRAQPGFAAHPIGYFGASTGAAAAMCAAADPRVSVAAVVARGGRVDLAGLLLHAVRAPTLLIVGEHDPLVVKLNREAQSELRCENRLLVVPGASHLFEEPGTLEAAATAAGDWFGRHLAPGDGSPH